MSNALAMQSGGSTAVLNSSLFGVAAEAAAHPKIETVYGAEHALDGLLNGRIHDLGDKSRAWWHRAARTPGAVLGSSRRSLKAEDVPTLIEVLKEHDVGFLFIIGGNDSAETGHRIGREARQAGLELAVVNVPKTIDNDLVLTDHSPGYGSAARFIALATMGAGRDAESMGRAAPMTTLEVMGRDAGWLAASAVLGKREERDAPHVVCLPEVPVDVERFLELMEDAYRRFGFAVAVVAENARGTDGGVLGGDQDPWYFDEFGHPYYEGAGRYLATAAGRRLNARVRYEKPGTIQRSMATDLSEPDVEEAEMAGRAAVTAALDGETDVMVTLVRQPGAGYACTTELAPLSDVAGAVKRMPENYLDPERYMVTEGFVEYATPLIGASLPRMERID